MPRFDRTIYPDSQLGRVVEALGGILPVARRLGVTERAVQTWLRAGGVPSTVHALALAEAAQVDVRQLAPPARAETRGRKPA